MTDSRSVSLVGIVVAVVAVAALGYLVLSDDAPVAPIDDLAVVGETSGDAPSGFETAERPLSSETGEIAALDVAEDDEKTGIAAITYLDAGGPVRGRVVPLDGGPLPVGATIEVRLRRPDPWIENALENDDFTATPFELPPLDGPDEDAPRTVDEWLETVDGPESEGHRASLYWMDRVVRDRTRTEIDENGQFTLEDVPAVGGYLQVRDRICYVVPGHHVDGDELRLALGPNGVALEVPLERGGVIAGLVVDALGDPLDDVDVGASSRFDPWMIFDGGVSVLHVEDAESDEDGRFELRQIPPGHALDLGAEVDGFSPTSTSVAALRPGEVIELTVTLARGGVIEGQVVDAEGKPVTVAEVHLAPVKIDLMDLQAIERSSGDEDVDDEGRFRFEDLATGQYRLVLAAPMSQLKTEELEVTAGEVTACTLVTEPGLTLRGRVVSTAGEAIEGARVRAFTPPSMMSMRSQTDRRYRPSTTTDVDGAFELGGFEAGDLRVTVEVEGYEDTSLDCEAGDDDVVVTCAKRASLTGIVVSLDDGEPITRFTVGVVPPGGKLALTDLMTGGEDMMRRTRRPRPVDDENGTFHFDDVSPGEYDVYVRADGHAETFVSVTIPPETHVKGVIVMMSPSATVTGRVVDLATGLPIEGAQISTGSRGIANVMSELMLGVGAATLSDEEGHFELEGLADGFVQVSASHPDYLVGSSDEIEVREGESTDVGELGLSAGARIEGVVKDVFGEPVADVLVMASEPLGTTIRRTTTGRDGVFELRGLAPATYNVMRLDVAMDIGVDNPADMTKDMTWKTVEVVDDGVYVVELSAASDEGVTLEGHIRSKSGAPPTTMVTMIPQRAGMGPFRFASADSEGYYSVEGLKPGEYSMQVVPVEAFEQSAGAGGLPSSSITSVVEITAEPLQTHDVRLPDGRVHGVVRRDGSLDAVEGARVVLQRTDPGRPDSLVFAASDHRVGETYTDASGAFELKHIPEGRYTLTVGGRNMLGMGDPTIAITRVDELAVSERGTSFSQKIECEPGGAIRGVVRDVTGRPAAGVSVWARDPSGRWLSRLSEVTTDASGSFEIVGLASGSWTLACAHTNLGFTWAPDLVVDAPGTTDTVVVMPPGVQVLVDAGDLSLSDLEAEVRGPIGELPTDLRTLSQITSLTSGTPSSLLVTVPAGQWSVTLERDGSVVHRETVVLKPGQARYTLGPLR